MVFREDDEDDRSVPWVCENCGSLGLRRSFLEKVLPGLFGALSCGSMLFLLPTEDDDVTRGFPKWLALSEFIVCVDFGISVEEDLFTIRYGTII